MYEDYTDVYDLEFDTVVDCDHCGEEDLCAFTTDPLVDENGLYPKSWWCWPCYEDRKSEE